MKASIFIGMPNAHGIVHAETCASIFNLANDLAGRGISSLFRWTEGADVAQQRDEIAAMFLETDCTHLLFVDSDMSFEADLCARLLSEDRPLIGVAATHRRMQVDRLREKWGQQSSFDDAIALAYDYNVRSKRLEQFGKLIKVDAVGAGVMLIARSCFERMSDALQLAEYPSQRTGRPIKGYFRRVEAEDGSLLWEDWSFCQRWTSMGGEVFAYAFSDVKHFGFVPHGTPWARHLQARVRTSR
jgi:hypothetical protein